MVHRPQSSAGKSWQRCVYEGHDVVSNRSCANRRRASDGVALSFESLSSQARKTSSVARWCTSGQPVAPTYVAKYVNQRR